MKLLDVTGKVREPEKVEEKHVKPKYNWEYENSINSGKEPIDMDGELEFKYSQWRTNSSLSNHSDTIQAVNIMNMNHHLSNKLHYEFLYNVIRKKKRYGKKKTEEDREQERLLKEQTEKIHLIQQFYKYNVVRAREALSILTPEQIRTIMELQKKGE